MYIYIYLYFVFCFRSKIFIRFPRTLFVTEDALEAQKQTIGKTEEHNDEMSVKIIIVFLKGPVLKFSGI